MITVFHPYNREYWYDLLDDMLEHDTVEHNVIVIGDLSDPVTTELLEFLDADDTLDVVSFEKCVQCYQNNHVLVTDNVSIPVPEDFTHGYLNMLVHQFSSPLYVINNVDSVTESVLVDDTDYTNFLVEADFLTFAENSNAFGDIEKLISTNITTHVLDEYNPCVDCMDYIEDVLHEDILVNSMFSNVATAREAVVQIIQDYVHKIKKTVENIKINVDNSDDVVVYKNTLALASYQSPHVFISNVSKSVAPSVGITLKHRSTQVDEVVTVSEVVDPPSDVDDDIVRRREIISEWLTTASSRDIIGAVRHYRQDIMIRQPDDFEILLSGFKIEYMPDEPELGFVEKSWGTIKNFFKRG